MRRARREGTSLAVAGVAALCGAAAVLCIVSFGPALSHRDRDTVCAPSCMRALLCYVQILEEKVANLLGRMSLYLVQELLNLDRQSRPASAGGRAEDLSIAWTAKSEILTPATGDGGLWMPYHHVHATKKQADGAWVYRGTCDVYARVRENARAQYLPRVRVYDTERSSAARACLRHRTRSWCRILVLCRACSNDNPQRTQETSPCLQTRSTGTTTGWERASRFPAVPCSGFGSCRAAFSWEGFPRQTRLHTRDFSTSRATYRAPR